MAAIWSLPTAESAALIGRHYSGYLPLSATTLICLGAWGVTFIGNRHISPLQSQRNGHAWHDVRKLAVYLSAGKSVLTVGERY